MASIRSACGYTNKTRPSAFLSSVLQNGVGRPVKQLSRLTLKFCPFSASSKYMRTFVEENLVDFAFKHPTVVVYALPEDESEPQVCAEYLNGRQEVHELQKSDCEDISLKLDTLSLRSGLELARIIKDHRTWVPSIQGQWHSFYHKKDYDITKKLQFSTTLHDAWEPIGQPWQRYYRKHELHKLGSRPKLSFEEKSERPLGKWGPELPVRY